MDKLEDIECFIRSRYLFGRVPMSTCDEGSEKIIGMGEGVRCRKMRRKTS